MTDEPPKPKPFLPDLAADTSRREAARAARKEELVEALVNYSGNITDAAEALGLRRQWVTTLVRDFGLQEAAMELRRAGGGTGRGRPRTAKTYRSKRK